MRFKWWMSSLVVNLHSFLIISGENYSSHFIIESHCQTCRTWTSRSRPLSHRPWSLPAYCSPRLTCWSSWSSHFNLSFTREFAWLGPHPLEVLALSNVSFFSTHWSSVKKFSFPILFPLTLFANFQSPPVSVSSLSKTLSPLTLLVSLLLQSSAQCLTGLVWTYWPLLPIPTNPRLHPTLSLSSFTALPLTVFPSLLKP